MERSDKLMKVRIPKKIRKTIPVRINECLSFKDLYKHISTHGLVGMKVVKGTDCKTVDILHLRVDINDIIGVITGYDMGFVGGWIDVEFDQSDKMIKEFVSNNPKLIAVPRVFGEPTEDGGFKIKGLKTFVIYPAP